jgi:hypothetical protein
MRALILFASLLLDLSRVSSNVLSPTVRQLSDLITWWAIFQPQPCRCLTEINYQLCDEWISHFHLLLPSFLSAHGIGRCNSWGNITKQYGTVISSDIYSFPHFAGFYLYLWITMCHLLLPIIFLLIVVIASCSSVNAAQNNEIKKIGKPHSTVLQLTSSNFDDYIQDPANGLWLLDFYAPW